jgi:AhpD family alkylhydroperoxidase
MDTKTKELIAIGASVTANCVPCLKYHFAKARKAGTSDDEIREAIAVGRMVRKGAAGKWDEEAMTIFSAGSDSKTETTEETCGNI